MTEPAKPACATCPFWGGENVELAVDGVAVLFGTCREASPRVSDRIGNVPVKTNAALSRAAIGEHPWQPATHWCGCHPIVMAAVQMRHEDMMAVHRAASSHLQRQIAYNLNFPVAIVADEPVNEPA